MTDLKPLLPPPLRRQLGRSRRYTTADLPRRLEQWHAPRANRWERLRVVAGNLELEWLAPGGIATEQLHNGDERWIGPGMRCRMASMDADAGFELEIHADDATPVSTPQALRSAWLDEVAWARSDDVDAFRKLLTELATGEQRLVRGRFHLTVEVLEAILKDLGWMMFWHPLEQGDSGFTAFVARAAQPIGLSEYLGRDHAVIEAALAGALRGDAEPVRWLKTTLARHLVIEEELLFPAYLHAGGRTGWVDGLRNEHERLRRGVTALSDAASRRRFLLLLDGHDEKEEQIVYPDIVVRLGAESDVATHAAMLCPAIAESLEFNPDPSVP